MDNYYHECPPIMNDSRSITDYRSSQVREAYYRHKHCLVSENDTRMYRTDNADTIMDNEWKSIINKNFCAPRKNCYHFSPTTRTTNEYNVSELLSYNGNLPKRSCPDLKKCSHFRMTQTKGNNFALNNCYDNAQINPSSKHYKCPIGKNDMYTHNIPTNLYPPSF